MTVYDIRFPLFLSGFCPSKDSATNYKIQDRTVLCQASILLKCDCLPFLLYDDWPGSTSSSCCYAGDQRGPRGLQWR